jgi:hypothetical protein
MTVNTTTATVEERINALERTVEERLAQLEEQVSLLTHDTAPIETAKLPWWERRFGAFKDSPEYESAMRYGLEYRRSQPTAADENLPANNDHAKEG